MFNLTINEYLDRVIEEEDKVLFQEAVLASDAGALRTAYIALWLSCAESIKRKFREAANYDNNAGKVVGEITRKEANKNSVDAFLLEKAKEYGFISDSEYDQLLAIYTDRCIYGHPYEKAPLPEQVQSAAAIIVAYVLGRTTQLRNGYFSRLLDDMLSDKHFLDTFEPTVKSFAEIVISKTAPDLHLWFLRTLWKKAFPMSQDPTMTVFWNRAVWFTQIFLEKCSDDLWSGWQVTADLTRYPFLGVLMANKDIFPRLDDNAKDYIVSQLLDNSGKDHREIDHMITLKEINALTPRQVDKLRTAVENAPLRIATKARIHPKNYVERIIEGFESHNWYEQNPSANAVLAMGPDKISKLDDANLESLGRNLLQSAEGGANDSIGALQELSKMNDIWPGSFIKGILFECFVNENLKYRLKPLCCEEALLCLSLLPDDASSKMIESLIEAIEQATPKQEWRVEEKKAEALKALDKVMSQNHDKIPDLTQLREIISKKELQEDE